MVDIIRKGEKPKNPADRYRKPWTPRPKQPEFQADSTPSRITDFKPAKFKSKRDAEKDFIEFCGFRGYYDKKGYPVIDVTHTREEREVIDNETGEIIEIEYVYEFKYEYHKGEAHPEPVDEKNVYWGILPHEVEGFHAIRRYLKTGIMFKWPRGAGKTYLACWFIEWSMSRLGYPWLYLSETAIMNDVAFWIWQWAQKTNQVASSSRGDKQNTYTQFELNNGAALRIYGYLEEKSVGQHGWYLAFDDIIKKKWSEKPSEVKKAKMQWTYSLSHIKRKGLMIFGTRKFIGDPLEFLEKVVNRMHIEVKTPYIMEGEFPDWNIKYDESTGKEILWCPELYTHESLDERKVTPTEDDVDPMEAFKAEMMQDPSALGGYMVGPEDLEFTTMPNFKDNVHMVGIGVDLSWADDKDSSDMCAVVSCIGHSVQIDKKWYRRFTFIRSDVARMPLYDDVVDGRSRKGVYTIIGEHFKYLRKYFPHIPLIIAIERNSGGMVIIKVAMRENFDWIRHVIADKGEIVKWQKDGKANIQLGINHKKNKIARIYGELQNSIKAHEEWGVIEGEPCHETQFDWALEGSTFIVQLLGFPKKPHDDGPDAAGMIKDELNRRWSAPKKVVPRAYYKHEHEKTKAQEKFNNMAQPWLAVQKNARDMLRRQQHLRKAR